MTNFKNSFSQEDESGGSPYSIFAIGDLTTYTSTRTYSMGIVGNSLFGNYVNNLNPATLTKLNSTLISINADYGFLKSSNATSENKTSNGNVRGINIGIPFDQGRGWVFSLGFNPYSLENYKIRILGNVGSQSYSQTYSGKGGLSRISVGMTYNLYRMVSVGLEYNYGFGEIKNQNFINFNNQAYTNTNIRSQFDFQKSFMKGGLVFELGKIFKSFALKDFTIGAVYQSGFNLSATEDAIIANSLSIDTVQLRSGEIVIPELYGFGITNIFKNRYVVSADLLIQDWSKYSEFGKSNPSFQNSFRAGLGFEILRDPERNSFWQSMTYRFGGFYEKLFYKVNGQDINSYGLRAGINIPLSQYNSLDFGFNYSVRGTTNNNLIKDEFFNMTAGLNFGELWFLRPREEDQ